MEALIAGFCNLNLSNRTTSHNTGFPRVDHQAAESPRANKKHISLMALPNEILDMILDFDFPEVDGLRLFTRENRDKREFDRSLHTENYQKNAFPPLRISDMLVCKEYFSAATKTYLGNQKFNLVDIYLLCINHEGRELRHYINEVTCTPCDLDAVWDLIVPERLIRATLTLGREDLRDSPKRAWKMLLTDDDLLNLELYTKLLRYRGLKWLRLVANEQTFGLANGIEDLRIWKANVQRLQELVQPHVTRPKDSSDATSYNLVQRPANRAQPTQILPELGSEDVPDTLESLLAMATHQGPRLLSWIQNAKTQQKEARPKK